LNWGARLASTKPLRLARWIAPTVTISWVELLAWCGWKVENMSRDKTYWCALNQSGGHIAAFVCFGGGLVGENTPMNAFDILHNGVGGDESRKCGRAGECDGREEEGG
jgi:hypothetical protein